MKFGENMKIPDYINCNNEEIVMCDYYFSSNCPNTCAYCHYIGSDVTMDLKFLKDLEKLAMFMEDENKLE